MTLRPRRSVLYMPGSNARALEKAKTLAADCLILDLEDAVAPDAKALAREQIAAAVTAGGYGRREVVVRVNDLNTEWGADDMSALAPIGPDALLVPKVNSAQDIEQASSALDDAGAGAHVGLWAMIETPLSVLGVEAVADTANRTRLKAFVMGTNDLAKETGARLTPGRAPFLGTLMTCVLAARAHGLAILDGVYNDIADAEGFAAECGAGRDFGFDGKTLIHPSQIGPCNEIFAPDDAEVTQARKIVAAFDLPENAGQGVITVDGRMVELLHAEIARRTVAVAEAIAAMQQK
ncbi:MAG: HpcH/HpaI aldolase/citrate lyase family protein [Hyphomicrobiales bacterium]